MIDQIIALKEKHDIVETDATRERQIDWYNYCIKNGLLITEFIGDRLVGFLEYIFIRKVPKNMAELDETVLNSGPVLLVCNCVADSKDILWKMKKKLFCREWKYMVWHRKKTDVMKVFKNIRRKYAV